MCHSLASRKRPMGGEVADDHGNEACGIQPAVVLLNPRPGSAPYSVSFVFRPPGR